MKKLVLAIAITLAFASIAIAHPGKRDAYGGHFDTKTGKYHVHEGPLSGQTYNNQENMLKALAKKPGGQAIINKAKQPVSGPALTNQAGQGLRTILKK